ICSGFSSARALRNRAPALTDLLIALHSSQESIHHLQVMLLNIFPSPADMTAHQQLRQIAVTGLNGLNDATMLRQRLLRPIGGHGKLVPIHAHQMVDLANQQIRQSLVVAALDYPVMEIQITFALEIGGVFLE